MSNERKNLSDEDIDRLLKIKAKQLEKIEELSSVMDNFYEDLEKDLKEHDYMFDTDRVFKRYRNYKIRQAIMIISLVLFCFSLALILHACIRS